MDVAVATRAGRPGWINRRTVLGVVLVTMAVSGGYSVLEAAEKTTPVWVAARDLPSGSIITSGALRIEHVHLSPRLHTQYASSAETIEGSVVTRPVGAGEMVPQGLLANSGSSDGRAIAVPIDPEHAVGGSLRPGDLVEVFATFNPGDSRARTVSLVREVEVIEVISAGGLVMGDESIVGLTISVSPGDAQRVVFASRTAELDVVRVDDPSARNDTSVVTGADF